MDYVIAAQPPPAWFWLLVVGITVVCIAVELLVIACLFWLISKLVIPHTGTFRNACRLVGYIFLLGLATFAVYFAVSLSGLFFFLSKSGPSLQFIQILNVFIWLAQVAFTFVIIMHVYEVSFWRALGFQVVYFVIVAGLVIGGAILMINSMPANVRADMKRMIAEASHGGRFTLPAPLPSRAPVASGPVVPSVAPPRLSPGEVALIEPVQIPVVINGRNAGEVTLQPGTRVKLVSVEGDLLKIQYLDTVTTIPKKSTDYHSATAP